MTQRAGDLREEVWTRLLRERVAAYPLPPHGHHPNFRGASEAAALLAEYLMSHTLLQAGDAVLCYPDYVLRPLRKHLLEEGVHVVVPAKYGDGFRRLESGRVPPTKAATIAGAERYGENASLPENVRWAFLACVACDEGGGVLHKGYGFDLPPALSPLPTATLLHPLQCVPTLAHPDRRVKLYATPQKVRDLSP